jgi:hypothetical protein
MIYMMSIQKILINGITKMTFEKLANEDIQFLYLERFFCEQNIQLELMENLDDYLEGKSPSDIIENLQSLILDEKFDIMDHYFIGKDYRIIRSHWNVYEVYEEYKEEFDKWLEKLWNTQIQ